MTPRPLRSTLFPYTTLFRSKDGTYHQTCGQGHPTPGRTNHQGKEIEADPCISGTCMPCGKAHTARHTGRACFKQAQDRKSTRLNSSHQIISYAVFCLKKKKK